MIHIVDQSGVLLQVDYTPAVDASGPTFNSIRVMDDQYRPVGPNLAPLFMLTLLLDEHPAADGVLEGEPLLSMLTGELPCQT